MYIMMSLNKINLDLKALLLNLFYTNENGYLRGALFSNFLLAWRCENRVRRSVDNLDIQSRNTEPREEEEADEGEETRRSSEEVKGSPTGPPPPPLSPLQQRARGVNQGSNSTTGNEIESSKTPQPLATISIQDLTSIQLRRTGTKMNATKTFSAPPPRSVSMTNGKLVRARHTCTYNLMP